MYMLITISALAIFSNDVSIYLEPFKGIKAEKGQTIKIEFFEESSYTGNTGIYSRKISKIAAPILEKKE